MKPLLFFSLAFVFSMYSYSQVGVNTSTPQATLDVVGNSSTTTAADGVLVPRISLANLKNKTAYSSAQDGTLIYVNDITGSTNAPTVNVTSLGFYYWDGTNSVWKKVIAGDVTTTPNIYTANGTVGTNRRATLTDSINFVASKTNAFNIQNGTKRIFSVDAANSRVGIGTSLPATKLDIENGTTAGAIKIVDGTQAAGNVLTSDANGVGTWKKLNLFNNSSTNGTWLWNYETGINNTGWNNIASLSVPAGTSMIYYRIHLLYTPTNGGYVRLYVGTKQLTSGTTNTADTPILGTSNFMPFTGKDFEIGTSFIYNNTTGANQTLYFNLQSDSPSIQRSRYVPGSAATFEGVSIIENYFYYVPM